MLKKLIPLILLLVGSGAGVAAGMFLRPAPEAAAPGAADHAADAAEAGTEHHAGGAEKGAPASGAHGDGHGETASDHGAGGAFEYVKLSNQFVVPVVKDRKVVALVVMSLSLEVPEGRKDAVFRMEPKLRDSFLQVLFDHANIGGFDGAFTAAANMNLLRDALRETAQRDIDPDSVRDVLILEIARQDY